MRSAADELPLGPLGLLAHSFVRPQLDAVFDFRRDAVAARFAEGAPGGAHTA